MTAKQVLVASDHAGRELKDIVIERIKDMGFEVKDMGTFSDKSTDYPFYSKLLSVRISNHYKSTPHDSSETDLFGVLICGTGTGMCITANRLPFVRAAVCYNDEVAKLSRAHNNANIACIGARVTSKDQAEEIIRTFLTTEFDKGRHAERVRLIDAT